MKGDLVISATFVIVALTGFVSNLCIHIQDGGRLIDMGMYLLYKSAKNVKTNLNKGGRL